MSYLYLDAVVTKVYDLLRLDSRTSNLDWYNGRRTLDQMQKLPGGNVYLGPGNVLAYTMPGGEQAPFRVMVEIVYIDQAGADKAEQEMRNGVDIVAEVLLETARQGGSAGWDLGLTYAYPEGGLSWRTISSPAENTAMAELGLDIRIIPTGS